MAEVTEEEYKDQIEETEYRMTQQQSLIDLLQHEAEDDDYKIKKLEQRVESEVNEADKRRAAVRAKIAAKEQEKEAANGTESPDE
jgi:aconitase B